MTILRTAATFAVGEVLNKAFVFFLIPILTRYLGVEQYADYQFYISIVIITSIITNFGVELAIARYYHFKGKGFLLNWIVIYYSIISLLLLALCAIVQSEIITIIVLSAMFQGGINAVLSVYIASKNASNYLKIQFVQAATNLMLTYFFIAILNGSVKHCFYALLIANSMAFLYGLFRLRSSLSVKNKLKISTRLVKMTFGYVSSFGFLIVVHQLSQSAKGTFDKLILYGLIGPKEMSFYSVGFQLAMIVQVALMTMNKAFIPYFYEGVKDNNLTDDKIVYLSIVSLLLCPILYVLLSFLPETTFSILLGEGFSEVKSYFIPMVSGVAMNLPYMIIGNYLFAGNRNGRMAIISMTSSLIYLLAIAYSSFYDVHFLKYALVTANFITVLIMVALIKVSK